MRRRGQTIEEERAKAGGAFTQIPVVVLVNEWSASASELLTGALQDHKRAMVVGAATFGKGSVQTILSLPSGAGLKLTIARYFTPSGHAIQADGIHPDVLLETSTRLAADGGAPVIRERDLENHLAPEGPQGGAPPEPRSRDAGAPGTPAPTSESLTVADVPADPTTSKDLVLRTGYQLLRSKIEGR
ncbi:MAG: S41 family peptidase, partial [Myxococcales bacterium]|nr:S41 family peptidase [Myxococcales bacterium]